MFLCQCGQKFGFSCYKQGKCGFHSLSDFGFLFFLSFMVFYDLVVEALIQNLVIKTYIWTPFRHNFKNSFLFLQFEVFKIGGSFFSIHVIIKTYLL